jgi:copper homeostasis protein (lipoprotein)
MVAAGVFFLWGAGACDRGGEKSTGEGGDRSAADDAGESRGPIALPARYEGVLPCADCSGIRYVLDLREGGRVVVRITYLGKGEGEGTSFEDIGQWSVGPDGRTITIRSDSERSIPLHFTVMDPQTLRKLDTEGKEIQSEANHNLRRVEPYSPLIAEVPQATTDASPATGLALENNPWKLVDLGGAPIRASGPQVPNLRLDGTQKRVSGFGGCNRIAGGYELEGETLRFPALISTKMACPDMELETQFLAAVNATTGWRITGDRLELLGSDGQVLARFAHDE